MDENEMSMVIKDALIGQSSYLLPLITVDEPIFFAINYMENIFLGYVLQDRTMIKENRIIDVKELLVLESSFDTVIEMLTNKISVYETFNKSTRKYRKGKIGTKVFPEKSVQGLLEINDKIPKQEYKLKLNNNQKEFYLQILESRMKRLRKYDNEKWHEINFNSFEEINPYFSTKVTDAKFKEPNRSQGEINYEFYN